MILLGIAYLSGNFEDSEIYFKGNYCWVGGYNSGVATSYENTYMIAEADVMAGTGTMIDTGADTQIEGLLEYNNIYDLAGNASEWSTERNKGSNLYRISGGAVTQYGQIDRSIDGDVSININAGSEGSADTSSRPILYK